VVFPACADCLKGTSWSQRRSQICNELSPAPHPAKEKRATLRGESCSLSGRRIRARTSACSRPARSGRSLNQLACGSELLRRQTNIRVPAEARREHPGRLNGRRQVEIVDPGQRSKRDPPGPARSSRVLLGVAHDVDDRKDHLPDGRVADCEIPALDRRPSGRMLTTQLTRVYVTRERVVAGSADEQPVLDGYRRSTMPAIAMPKPTHIVAIP
jgi:hypothetical protein